MRYIVKERLHVTRRGHKLETVGYYVQDTKRAEKASPVYRTYKHASGHADRLNEQGK